MRIFQTIKSLVSTNERLTSELTIVKNVNNILGNRIVNLEKQLSKNEQHGCRNNAEISGISNQIPDQDLEENIIKICKDSDINISPMDIEGCHRLPFGRNTINTTERVIGKFVNRKLSETMLQRKKDINSKNKVIVKHSLCSYYRFLWVKCKGLQREGRIKQVFCLEAVATIRVLENSLAMKILHERDLMVYQECHPDSVYTQTLDRPLAQTLNRLLPAPFELPNCVSIVITLSVPIGFCL